MTRATGLRKDLAEHLRAELGEDQRIVAGTRKVDVGTASLVQVALSALELGTGEDALHPRATFEVWVVVPGEGDAGEDRLDALLDEVLDALETHDSSTWTSARRTSYPPGPDASVPAFLVSLTQEV